MPIITKLSEVRAQSEAGPTPNQQQTAEYIASLSIELGAMAARAGMPFLAYLIDMTVQEALQQDCKPRRRRTDTH